MKPVFKNDAAKARMLEWFDRFRARLNVASESRSVAPRFGDTHVLVSGPVDARRRDGQLGTHARRAGAAAREVPGLFGRRDRPVGQDAARATVGEEQRQFPSLVEKELVANCRHCPPTTDAFREWLAGRLTTFLLAPRVAAAAG